MERDQAGFAVSEVRGDTAEEAHAMSADALGLLGNLGVES